MEKNIIRKIVMSLVVLTAVSWAGAVQAVNPQDPQVLPALSQTVRLEKGWNLISVPRPVASHVFSAPEISDSFDIYILDATKQNNWATMADLGQTEFTPLYGYFIRNKTSHFQTLIFNYKNNLEPQEKLLERKFTKSGWYSFAPAHTDSGWVGSQCSAGFDRVKTTDILKTLSGKYSQIVHFANNMDVWGAENYGVGSELYSYREDQVDNFTMGPYAAGNMSELYGYAIYVSADQASLDGVVIRDFLPSACPNYLFFGIKDYTVSDFARGSEANKIAQFGSNSNWNKTTEGYEFSDFTIKTAEQFPVKNLYFKVKVEHSGIDIIKIATVSQTIVNPAASTEYVINLDEPARVGPNDNLKIEIYGDIGSDAPALQNYSLVYLTEAHATSLATGLEKKLSNSFDQEFFPTVQSIASQKINIVNMVSSNFSTAIPDGLALATDVPLAGPETEVAIYFFTPRNETMYVRDVTFRLFGNDEILNKIFKAQLKSNFNHSVLAEEPVVKDDIGYKVKFAHRTDGTITDLGLNLWVEENFPSSMNYIVGVATAGDLPLESEINIKMVDYTVYSLTNDRDWTMKNEVGFPVDGRFGASLQQDPDKACPVLQPGMVLRVKGSTYVVNKKMEIMPFPGNMVILSWSDNPFKNIVEVSSFCIDALKTPTDYPFSVNYRPGTYLVQRESSDVLYVVEPNNTLAEITPAAAQVLYGTTDAMTIRLFDWGNYVNRGADIIEPRVHPGMIIRVLEKWGETIYYVDYDSKLREVTDEGFVANGFQKKFLRYVGSEIVADYTIDEERKIDKQEFILFDSSL